MSKPREIAAKIYDDTAFGGCHPDNPKWSVRVENLTKSQAEDLAVYINGSRFKEMFYE